MSNAPLEMSPDQKEKIEEFRIWFEENKDWAESSAMRLAENVFEQIWALNPADIESHLKGEGDLSAAFRRNSPEPSHEGVDERLIDKIHQIFPTTISLPILPEKIIHIEAFMSMGILNFKQNLTDKGLQAFKRFSARIGIQ